MKTSIFKISHLRRWVFLCLFITVLAEIGWQQAGAQNCYVQKDDASGFNTSPYLTDLETAACGLREAFPDSFRNRFKVYSFGFYVHNEVMAGGMGSVWNQFTNQIENDSQSDFYLIFGRESTSKGINSRIRVKLKLPTTPPFDCLSSEKRSNIEKYVESTANINLTVEYSIAEKKAIEKLKYYVDKIVICECAGIRKSGCDLNPDFEILDAELLALKFRKKQIEIGDDSNWASGTQGIFDYAGKTVKIDGIEYNIADQVSEGKAIMEAPVQVLPDTAINTSISGEVYILDNESFENNEWENAIARSNVLDYVEYWVILTNRRGEVFLYSRFTIGSFETEDPTLKGDDDVGRKSITLSPMGAALKALGNAALDACFQAATVRVLDEKINTWGAAWEEVSWLGALWEGISSLIPWKEGLTSTLIKTGVSALAVVIDKSRQPNYTVEEGVKDFLVGFAASGFTQLFYPKISQYGQEVIFKGLSRLDKFTTNQTFKKIIKIGWNSIYKLLLRAEPIPSLFNKFKHIIGNKGLNHIFRGEINSAGNAAGVHHVSAIIDGTARIVPSSIKNLRNGFYEAIVEVKDPVGNWIIKQEKSTFFPNYWDEKKVMEEIEYAIMYNAKAIGGKQVNQKYEGYTSTGIKIIFFRHAHYNDNILTAYPLP